MWPALFGSGWIWAALVAAALMCFVAGMLGFLFLITVKPRSGASDEVDDLWHRYEEGDLIRPEWERRILRQQSKRASKALAVDNPAQTSTR